MATVIRKEITLDRTSYTWNGKRWYETKSFVTPCKDTIRRLNDELRPSLAEADALEDDPYRLVEMASQAREALQFDRAEELCNRACNLQPGNPVPYTVLSSVLRKRGDPQHAVEVTEPYKYCDSPALLTTRAAALCDLGRWDEAKKTVGRSLAMGASDEAFSVVARIKKDCPRLY